MAENTPYIPTLTLTPDTSSNTPATAAIALEAAKAAEAAAVPAAPQLDMSELSELEQKAVLDFAEKIDITDSQTVLTYGATAQKNIADFSGNALENVRTKDLGEVGDQLSSLVVQLKSMNFGETEKKGLFGIRRKIQIQIEELKAQYSKAETNVDKIVEMLEGHQRLLLKDVAVLDRMYDLNQDYFKELTMYILAGKKKLEECRNVVMPELQKKAVESGKPEDAQATNDYQNMITRFEKKIYDLELTRVISIQMAPQIRLIQNNDTLMIEKIQTSIVNTIPLWKSQMVLALGIHHSQQAMQAQREVTDMTNELLKKNAERLKTGSIEVAKESERGIVDIQTLTQTNQTLIDTLEEVRSIQVEGSKKRAEAELELNRMEAELKKKLLELNTK